MSKISINGLRDRPPNRGTDKDDHFGPCEVNKVSKIGKYIEISSDDTAGQQRRKSALQTKYRQEIQITYRPNLSILSKNTDQQ